MWCRGHRIPTDPLAGRCPPSRANTPSAHRSHGLTRPRPGRGPCSAPSARWQPLPSRLALRGHAGETEATLAAYRTHSAPQAMTLLGTALGDEGDSQSYWIEWLTYLERAPVRGGFTVR